MITVMYRNINNFIRCALLILACASKASACEHGQPIEHAHKDCCPKVQMRCECKTSTISQKVSVIVLQGLKKLPCPCQIMPSQPIENPLIAERFEMQAYGLLPKLSPVRADVVIHNHYLDVSVRAPRGSPPAFVSLRAPPFRR